MLYTSRPPPPYPPGASWRGQEEGALSRHARCGRGARREGRTGATRWGAFDSRIGWGAEGRGAPPRAFPSLPLRWPGRARPRQDLGPSEDSTAAVGSGVPCTHPPRLPPPHGSL
eukprot:scaffold515_cov184-Prasinococcus_capsulatus_cf.AAC.1